MGHYIILEMQKFQKILHCLFGTRNKYFSYLMDQSAPAWTKVYIRGQYMFNNRKLSIIESHFNEY